MKADVKSQRGNPGFLVNEMRMALSARADSTWLWVEGPDDKAVLQKFLAPRCTVLVAGTRDSVLDVANQAVRQGIRRGYLCLVDADFTRFDSKENQPKSLPRRVAQLPHHPDLEGSIFFHYNRHLVRGLFSTEIAAEYPWIRDLPNEYPLDRLIHNVLAPLGSIRIAWRQCGFSHVRLDPTQSADFPAKSCDSVVCSLLEQVCVGNVERIAQVDELRGLLPIAVSDQDWRKLSSYSEEILRSCGADRWKVVRGKDIAVALGWLVYRFRGAVIHAERTASLRDAVRYVQTAMLHCMGREWLSDSGLAEELTAKLDSGESLDAYLLAEEASSMAA